MPSILLPIETKSARFQRVVFSQDLTAQLLSRKIQSADNEKKVWNRVALFATAPPARQRSTVSSEESPAGPTSFLALEPGQMGRRCIGKLGDAISKRPVFPRRLEQTDEHVFFPKTLLRGEKLSDGFK